MTLKYKVSLNNQNFIAEFKNEQDLDNNILAWKSSYDYVHVNRDEKRITISTYKNKSTVFTGEF